MAGWDPDTDSYLSGTGWYINRNNIFTDGIISLDLTGGSEPNKTVGISVFDKTRNVVMIDITECSGRKMIYYYDLDTGSLYESSPTCPQDKSIEPQIF
ncbi:MAG: hypothetical protein ABIA04_14595 [Pseudomonadota bacterium]